MSENQPTSEQVRKIIEEFAELRDRGQAPELVEFCAQYPKKLRPSIEEGCRALLEVDCVEHKEGHARRLEAAVADFLNWSKDAERSVHSHLVQKHPQFAGLLEHLLAARLDPSTGCSPDPILSDPLKVSEGKQDLLSQVQPRHPELLDRQGGSRFEVREFHAQGGLGIVHHAWDRELDRIVALKSIRPTYADSKEARGRFTIEAQVTGKLEHPGVVPIYSLWQDEVGKPSYAMRLIRGRTLAAAISEFYAGEGELTSMERNRELRKLLQHLISICRTVEYAHRRSILHRDIKPANIMIGKYGESILIDWGVTKVLESPGVPGDSEPWVERPVIDGLPPTDGRATGTLGFMSPEQASGSADVGPSTDIYGLGATLYCILTGRAMPFDFEGLSYGACVERVRAGDFDRPRDVRTDVPLGLEDICLEAMAVEAKDRPASAEELATRIETWLSEGPILTHRAEIERLREAIRESRSRIELLAALARALSELSLILSGAERYDEAEQTCREAISCYRYIVGEVPDQLWIQIELVSTQVTLSRILESSGRETQANEARARAMAECRRIAAGRPESDALRALLITRIDLGEELESVDDSSLAERRRRIPERSESDKDRLHSRRTPTEDLFDTQAGEADSNWPERELLNEVLTGPCRLSIEGVAGTGGMSTVWHARDLALRRRVAVKTLRIAPIAEVHARFRREALVTAQLDHPSIVSVFGYFESPDVGPCIAMQSLRGTSLGTEIRLYHESGRSQKRLRELLLAFAKASRAIHHANSRGVIHRDPKPHNIFLDPDGHVTVIDWGVCRVLHEDVEEPCELVELPDDQPDREATGSDSILGTPAYMSPEQVGLLGGEPSVSPATDVYILGAGLLHLLTNRTQLDPGVPMSTILTRLASQGAPSPRSIDPSIDRRLDAIVRKATALQPPDRYASAADLADDIQSWLEGGEVKAHPETRVGRLVRSIRRKLMA